jgi:hypothetical protein
MGSVTLTSPPTATARLVVDTDIASFVFKWHTEFALRYVANWDETGKTAAQSRDGKAPLAAKRKPAKRARTSRAKLKRAAG